MAQIKGGLFEPDESNPPMVKEASHADDFKHGNRLVITRKDGSRVAGTLVRVDRKGKRLFLRTEPGEPPVAVQNDDVKKAEKIMVRPAGGGSQAEKTDNQPEIHRMIIRQGTDFSVHYFAPNVSHGERTSLAQLEAAENELSNLQALSSLNGEYVQNERALQVRRRQVQETYLLAQDAMYRLAVASWVPPYLVNYPGYYFGMGGYNGAGLGSTSISPPETGNEGALQTTFATTLAKGASSEAIARARENLAVAQRNAVYEDGRIVAVVYEEPKK
jgi:hypothetical protein